MKQGLIESDWNLKIVCAVAMAWYVKGLIESDWNLKYFRNGWKYPTLTGINRIRLEFKARGKFERLQNPE